MRRTLPGRFVTVSTIEDAYVGFILYCNPAVPPDSNTLALREAFQTPPRSGGKSFSIYTLYLLICQLEKKQIKTWAELALKLGVDPPDQDSGQSSQKIQQYAVRLKRWMHSMHVDAFFDYLMDRSHPYWTQVPSVFCGLGDQQRDGVAAKDDMALRALMPEIKPRRGRRRPDEEANQQLLGSMPPLQRQRIDGMPEEASTWPAHSQNNNMYVFTQPPNTSGLPDAQVQASAQHQHQIPMSSYEINTVLPTPPVGASWTSAEISSPLTAFPPSVLTPSTTQSLWADEPKPTAITPQPTKPPRSSGRRHGAKVVSSAWRSSSGTGGSGKTRGRPPINRNNNSNVDASKNFSNISRRSSSSTNSIGHGNSTGSDKNDSNSNAIGSTNISANPNTISNTSTITNQQIPITSEVPLSAFSAMDQTSATFSESAYSSQISTSTSPPELVATYATNSALPQAGSSSSGGSLYMPIAPQPQLATADDEVPSSSKFHEERPERLAPQARERSGSDVRWAGFALSVTQPGILNGYAPMSTSINLLDPNALTTPLYYGGFSGNVAGLQQMEYPQGELVSQSFGNNIYQTYSATPDSGAHHMFPQLSSAELGNMIGFHSDFGTGADRVGSARTASAAKGSGGGGGGGGGDGSSGRQPLLFDLPFRFSDQKDRTNVDETYAFFVHEIICAKWYDAEGRQIQACSIEEASALADTVMTNLIKKAPNAEALLINVAILTGAKVLMDHSKIEMKRIEETDEYTLYGLNWELRFGGVRASFSMVEKVLHALWEKMPANKKAEREMAMQKDKDKGGEDAGGGGDSRQALSKRRISVGSSSDGASQTPPSMISTQHASPPDSGTAMATTATPPDDNAMLAAMWEKRYHDLIALLHTREKQLERMRARVIDGLKER